jgi:DNA-directed RNA polymerase subunit alpha
MKNIFENPTTQVIEGGDFDSRFLIYPLERGYGTTLGNALKRVLLSSLPGVSIYSIKINGISNEFDSLIGLKEDIIGVIQNLKKIVFKKESGFDHNFSAKLSLNETGPKIVTAEDLTVVPGVVVVNPLQRICQIEEGKSIELEVNIRVGIGYASSKENQAYVKETNEIAIDSLFSPVERVNFEITKTMGDNDELSLTVVTNGSISSVKSLIVATQLINGYLDPLIELSPNVSFPFSNPIYTPIRVEEEDNSDLILNELPASVSNNLKRNNFFTIKQIIDYGKEDLTQLKGFGPSALANINDLFEKYHISWGDDENSYTSYDEEEEQVVQEVEYFKLKPAKATLVGDEFSGTINVAPLVKRYGTTLGNSLRRVLLSSLPGVAIYAIKIAGVQHEFQTISGCKEDVMEIVQNLKKVIFRVDSKDIDFTANLKIDIYGQATVTAGNFEKVTGVYVVNPDSFICTLAPNCHFELEAKIRIGVGYVSADDNKDYLDGEQRVISIDSLFSPIDRVTFQTSQSAESKDYEELSIIVETNKSISSIDGISLAAIKFKEYLSYISLIKIKEVPIEIPVEVVDVFDESKDQTLDSPLDRLNFSRRLLHALTRANYKSLREIHDSKPEEILRIKNLGSKTYRELIDKFKSLGITWGYSKNLVFSNSLDNDEGDEDL